MIRIALLDDHPAVRAGIQAILAPESDIRLVGSACSEPELCPLLKCTHPAVVVLDLHHPGRDGLALSLQIKSQPDPPAVLLYSARTPTRLTVAATVAGADAIINKSSTAVTLLTAIRAVARNGRTIAPISPHVKADAAARLDPADHAILAMRVVGVSPLEIAHTLGIPDTRITHRIAAIVAKLEPLQSPA